MTILSTRALAFAPHFPRQFTRSLARNMSARALVVDPFCFRQFAEHAASASYQGTVFDMTIADFEKIANDQYNEADLKPGYAPFCKHLFIKNNGVTDARVNVLEITAENQDKLRTRYEARNDKELPVLTRYFAADLVGDNLPVASHLDLILYSRDQINQENEAQGRTSEEQETAPWGIVSIKAQNVDHELPMNPITMMRNALGKAEGGSGVPLDRDAYMESVNYWKDHAVVS
jgi:Protein of unknown function (DUF3228)